MEYEYTERWTSSGTRVVVGNWLSAGANKWSNISFNTKPKRLSGGNRLVLIWIILFTVAFHGSIMPLFGISSRHRTFCNWETVSTVCKLWYYRALLYSTVVRLHIGHTHVVFDGEHCCQRKRDVSKSKHQQSHLYPLLSRVNFS